jgi:hypothetical protein
LTGKIKRPSLIAPGCADVGMAMAAPGCAGVGMAIAAPGGVSVGMEPRMPSALIPDRPPPPIMSSAASAGMVLSAVAKNRIETASDGRGAPELGVR